MRAGFKQVRPPRPSPDAGFRQVRPRARPSRWHVVNQPQQPVVIPNYQVDPATVQGIPAGTDTSAVDAVLQRIIQAANPRLMQAQQAALRPRLSGPVNQIPTFGPPPGTDMGGTDAVLQQILTALAAASARRTPRYAV